MIRKSDIDRKVAQELGESQRDVTITTELFLRTLMEHIAKGEEVQLIGFGKFHLARQGGASPPHTRYGGGANADDQAERFRVCFSKSVTFKREVKRRQKEKRPWRSTASMKR